MTPPLRAQGDLRDAHDDPVEATLTGTTTEKPGRTVQSVLGAVPVTDLGTTLTHEHLFTDLREAWHQGVTDSTRLLADEPVTPGIAWLLREDAYCCRDNCVLDSEDDACSELARFADLGGQTIVDNTTGASRDPAALARVAERTGLNIVMGSGWSLAHGSDDNWGARDPDDLAAGLVEELTAGVPLPDGRRVRPGIIGEIGVGPNFTTSERITLVAAARAQTKTHVPLFIHLPGWQRRGNEVLDIVLHEGVHPGSVVLCHMDPSGGDLGYQRDLAARGAWLEFDMIAMACNFPGEGRAPSVEDTAHAVAGLIRDGLTDQLLLSHDVFLKCMLTSNGGNGYSFIPAMFDQILQAEGLAAGTVDQILTSNPQRLFNQP